MYKHILRISTLVESVLLLFQYCVPKSPLNGICFEKGFFELQQEAEQHNLDFCLVLSQPKCPPCEWFYDRIYADNYQSLKDKVLFNFIDITLPQNSWYQQLIASKGVPTSLYFSPDGKLLAIISGSGKASFDCLTRAANESYQCASYLYKSPVLQSTSYPDMIKLFNATLQAKLKTDKGEDASVEIEQSLGIAIYPFNLWLQMEEAKQLKQEKQAMEAAKRLLEFTEPLYAVLYADLYAQAERIVTPILSTEDIPKLSIDDEEIDLGTCNFGDSINFSIKVRNSGKSTLHIYSINVSCSCVQAMNNDLHSIEPENGINLDFKFTADVKGDVRRNIFVITNDIRPVAAIRVLAHVKK